MAYSIVTVFIAFLALMFSESPIYRSGVVVVIGVTILLLEILTLTPFIMKVLGTKLFWPSKNAGGHKPNRYWGKASFIAVKHPIITVTLILLIIAPALIFHQEKLNFDTVVAINTLLPKQSTLLLNISGKGSPCLRRL
nr:MMPL family transporter [Heyndrickxia coagulans]